MGTTFWRNLLHTLQMEAAGSPDAVVASTRLHGITSYMTIILISIFFSLLYGIHIYIPHSVPSTWYAYISLITDINSSVSTSRIMPSDLFSVH
jgi:hypothetical protein